MLSSCINFLGFSNNGVHGLMWCSYRPNDPMCNLIVNVNHGIMACCLLDYVTLV
ncbi:unnamed protein product [Acanthoscelides obtectus]|uniref:Uncharacterized protein n=1 Tax=Acanthoscelides obtectus TaxID=200917 RepID=A0A9P0LWY7_ACAOB|nr:unnamed protein product [Acanthoscelides obtectus]CAK1678067.1 hypothetical protein AOBTE_LOCUS31742 [Acanthoscelides obtectus]